MIWQTEWQERTYALRQALHRAEASGDKAEKTLLIQLLTEHRAILARRRREGVLPPCFVPISPEAAQQRKERTRAESDPLARWVPSTRLGETRQAHVIARRAARSRVEAELRAVRDYRRTDQIMRDRHAVEVGRPGQ